MNIVIVYIKLQYNSGATIIRVANYQTIANWLQVAIFVNLNNH